MTTQYGEPWAIDDLRVTNAAGYGLMDGYTADPVHVAPELERAVAAVNAVAGIPDAALEASVIGRMTALLRADEWGGAVYDGYGLVAGCNTCERPKHKGHTPTCERGAVIALLGDAPAASVGEGKG